ncbi:lysophospholipase [Shimia gijangensis]|uniref:Lysophospholipase n=1 Tax=Shimia gijangensis TaxID=1470563 RepID=A0A1M6J3Z7_9RHOB|nr:alpha/beta hydrolase [Shimia gijangensis]SHJ41434.1 lysophospholipase [Shimia gijangensis]
MEMHPAPFHHDVAEGPENGTAHWLTTTDGVRIRISHWRAPSEKGTVLLFPGRTEYVEKYGRTAEAFAKRGYAMVAIDWRGQGLADRLLEDRSSGFVENFDDYQTDIAAVLSALEALDLPKPYFLVAHSMGGAIGLRALMAGLPVNAAMFSAPMWGILMSAVMRPAAWAMSWTSKRAGFGHKHTPGTKAETYVLAEPFKDNTLTHDEDMFRYMQKQMQTYPDMALGGPSMHWLHEALKDTRELAGMASPDMPCLTFLGDQEQIVDPSAIHSRMANWPKGELVLVENAEHEVLMELPATREAIHDQTAAFFDKYLDRA